MTFRAPKHITSGVQRIGWDDSAGGIEHNHVPVKAEAGKALNIAGERIRSAEEFRDLMLAPTKPEPARRPSRTKQAVSMVAGGAMIAAGGAAASPPLVLTGAMLMGMPVAQAVDSYQHGLAPKPILGPDKPPFGYYLRKRSWEYKRWMEYLGKICDAG